MYKVLHCDCQTISEVYSRYSCSYLFHRATRIAIIADENDDLVLKGLGREAFDLDVGVLAKHYFGKLHAAPSTVEMFRLIEKLYVRTASLASLVRTESFAT